MKVLKAIFKRRGSVVWFSVTIAVVALLLVATILVTGPFRSIIGTVLGGPGPIMREGVEQIYTSDYNSKQESKEAGDALNVQIASEGFVLLMNDGNGLPIRTPESETEAAARARRRPRCTRRSPTAATTSTPPCRSFMRAAPPAPAAETTPR